MTRLTWLLGTVALITPAAAQTPQPVPAAGETIQLDAVGIEAERERALDALRGFIARQEITGTKTDTPLIENPQSISVVPRSQIDARQAQTLGEALRYNSGIRTEVYGPDSRTDWLQIRGFDAQDNGIFLNGMRYNAGYAGSVYETYGLERYEILRGPASVLYGQIAPGGIVNQVSRRPTQNPEGEVRLSAGSFNRLQTQGYASGPLTADGVWSYSVTGLVRDSRTQVENTRDDRYFVAPALTWRPDADTRLTLMTYYQRDNTSGGQFMPYQGTVVPTPFGRIARDRFTGEQSLDQYARTQYGIGYEFERRLNDTWTLRQNFRYAHTGINWDQVYGIGLAADGRSLNRFGYRADIDVDTVQVDNQAQARFRTGPLQHTALFGFDYSHVNYRNAQAFALAPSLDLFAPVYGSPLPSLTQPALSTRQETSQYGLYAQDQIRWDRWLLTAGLRHDWVPSTVTNRVSGTSTDQDDRALTGRIGLIYLADNGLAPYASYARSFQPQLGTNAAGSSFEPLEGEQFEVGLKYQPPGLNSFMQLSTFQLTQQNSLITDQNNPAFQAAVGETRVRGVELEGTASLTQGLNLIASLTYLDAEITRGTPDQQGNRPPGVPKFAGGLFANYTFQEGSGPLAGLGIGAGVRYLGNTSASATNNTVVRSATLMDASLRYDLGQLSRSMENTSVQFNVSNLFDTRYVARCSSESACFYGTGRTMIGSLVYRW